MLNIRLSNEREKRTVMICLALYAANFLANRIPSKKMGVIYGATTAVAAVLTVASRISGIKEALGDLSIKYKRSMPYDIVADYINNTMLENLVSYMVNIIVQSFTLQPYNTKALKSMIKDKTKQSTYFVVGFIVGVIIGLIIIKKYYKALSGKDIKKIIQDLPKGVALALNTTKNSVFVALVQFIAFVFASLGLMQIIVAFFKALKATIKGERNLVDALKKEFKLKQISISTNYLKRLAMIYYYIKFRGIKPKQALMQFKLVKRKSALKDLRDLKKEPKTPEGKKLYEAIQLVKEALKRAGKRLNIPIYAARYPYFNAFFEPVERMIVILVDNREFKKLTAREIAAILLHEIGHANELESVYATALLGTAAVDVTLSLLTILLLPYFLKQNPVKRSVNVVLESLAISQLGLALDSFGRQEEMAADAFATALGFGTDLASALEKLHADHNMDPSVEMMYAADPHDIPQRRIRVIRELAYELAKQEKDIVTFA